VNGADRARGPAGGDLMRRPRHPAWCADGQHSKAAVAG
jgi:hypothetical protein